MADKDIDSFLIEKYEEKIGILKNKEKTADINKKKKNAWEEITNSVNALDGKSCRTVSQVKTRYKNMYNRAKQKLSRIRSHSTTTGGGSPFAVKLTPTEQKIADLFGESPTFKGIPGSRESSVQGSSTSVFQGKCFPMLLFTEGERTL